MGKLGIRAKIYKIDNFQKEIVFFVVVVFCLFVFVCLFVVVLFCFC